MKILGIETSCDETAVAIVDDHKTIHANIVLSQLKEHEIFGGVVPEIAARAHLDHLDRLLETAVKESGIALSELDGIAATCGPGLIGGVMVGMMAGKALSATLNLPFIAVNHLEAHILTARLTSDIDFPYLALLVSGGHSQLLIAKGVGEYELLGSTLDDALGEAFDKSAKLMGLPYPGGPNLEKIAMEAKNYDIACKRFPLPAPLLGRKNCDFSFSGLKTAVRTHVDNLPEGTLKREDIADLACSFQDSVSRILKDRCQRALDIFVKRYKKGAFVVAGGVAANRSIRKTLTTLAKGYDMPLIAPPLELCSDNGAMIAWAGIERLRQGKTDALDIAAKPRWPLEALQN